MAERFHIGEWYGHPFLSLTPTERVALAKHKVGGSAMKKAEVNRLSVLEQKLLTKKLTPTEAARLSVLRGKLLKQQQGEKPCPFRTDVPHPTCTKAGGVCSLQLVSDDAGPLTEVAGDRGKIRALCPYRFHQDNTVFKHIGQDLLGDTSPSQLGEVGFLESTGNLDSQAGAAVGNIDMILVSKSSDPKIPIKWSAVEIQAVYFSGKEMPIEFKHIESLGGAISMPKENRRPDYRSSGPKRLMPQLQIKVPTLRRWGKKMAVVVDWPFFASMGKMRTVDHVSNSDIVWYIVDFPSKPGAKTRSLRVVDTVYTTLESAIEGLTGGVPVSLDEFETRILAKSV